MAKKTQYFVGGIKVTSSQVRRIYYAADGNLRRALRTAKTAKGGLRVPIHIVQRELNWFASDSGRWVTLVGCPVNS